MKCGKLDGSAKLAVIVALEDGFSPKLVSWFDWWIKKSSGQDIAVGSESSQSQQFVDTKKAENLADNESIQCIVPVVLAPIGFYIANFSPLGEGDVQNA